MKPRRDFSHIQRPIGPRGFKYRSKMECNYAAYLDWLLKVGQIQSWAYEPVTMWFTPWPPPWRKGASRASVWSNPMAMGLAGVSRGSTNYTPDFGVEWRVRPTTKDGRSIIGGYVEVKGYMDARSKIVIDRARRYFPAMRLDVITSQDMGILRRQVGGLVPWI